MKVECLDSVDRQLWNEPVFEGSNIFHSYEWAEVKKTEGLSPIFILARDNGKISGAVLLLQELPGKRFCERAAALFARITIFSDPVVVSYHTETAQLLFQAADCEARKRKAVSCEWQTYFSRYTDMGLFVRNGYTPQEHGAYLIDLSKDRETIWNRVHRDHRREIRNSERAGVRMLESDDISTFYRLTESTYRRSAKKGPSYSYLQSVARCMQNKEMSRLFFALREGEVLAAILVLLCNKTMTALHAASAENAFGGVKLLYWRVMEWGQAQGFQRFDLGGAPLHPAVGSKNAALKLFKERLGAELLKVYGGHKLYSPIRSVMLSILMRCYSKSRKSLAFALHMCGRAGRFVSKEDGKSDLHENSRGGGRK